ncbi:hypothetical protein PF007_g15382 [Phytophthora fragariae]|uniref:Uncharacterized protein n=1 Tax=Phytophthora fragariae TaxID=53985 RepID=A0A6A3RUT5_9STRA|nr:hypothetical protein PF007_g15382 [Phytophthora fragariae]
MPARQVTTCSFAYGFFAFLTVFIISAAVPLFVMAFGLATWTSKRSEPIGYPKHTDANITFTRNKYQSILKGEFPLELDDTLSELTIEWEQWATAPCLETAPRLPSPTRATQPRTAMVHVRGGGKT